MAAERSLASAREYAGVKRAHLRTEAQCREAGVEFVPVVAESTGAWEPTAAKVLRQLARSVGLARGKPVATTLPELLQRLSVTIRRAQARALLRRVGA